MLGTKSRLSTRLESIQLSWTALQSYVTPVEIWRLSHGPLWSLWGRRVLALVRVSLKGSEMVSEATQTRKETWWRWTLLWSVQFPLGGGRSIAPKSTRFGLDSTRHGVRSGTAVSRKSRPGKKLCATQRLDGSSFVSGERVDQNTWATAAMAMTTSVCTKRK